jgi:hypothetical protein
VRLRFHTHTNYTAPGNSKPGGAVKQLQLFFDDDFFFKTDALPACPPARLQPPGPITLQEAMVRCGISKVSVSPTSTARFTSEDGRTFDGCVLVFNGQGATTEVLVFIRIWVPGPANCSFPARNTGGDTAVLLKGDLRANPNGPPIPGNPADYFHTDACTGGTGQVRLGCQIDFANIPKTESNPSGASPFPLTDLAITIQKGKYINARCVDPNATLNLKTKFTYVPVEPSDTVKKATACT